jgi:peptidoglycan/LPS O-acetylase OafA/YrhL
MNRIESLDWHRGLLAFAIMLYHLTSWELAAPDSSTFLGRLGIYGVSMFFVLSGLSMAIVYNKYIRDARSSVKFFVRRIFRIWPLLWIAIGFATCAALVTAKRPDWMLVVLNLTTAFGFVSPAAALNTGAWSIGNEMVYYALTPFIIMAYNKRLLYGNLMTGAAVFVGMFFAFNLLQVDQPLAQQWAIYVNPFNNLFLYCSGIALFYNAHQLKLGGAAASACFVVALAIFLLLPAAGDQIVIVTGLERIAFSVASVLLVLAFYKADVSIPGFVRTPLTQLGVVTYGVYLLHPIAHQVIAFGLKKAHLHMPALGLIGATIALTVILALVSYRLLEEPFIRLGKRLTSRVATGPVMVG